jgi:hypothetical protein
MKERRAKNIHARFNRTRYAINELFGNSTKLLWFSGYALGIIAITVLSALLVLVATLMQPVVKYEEILQQPPTEVCIGDRFRAKIKITTKPDVTAFLSVVDWYDRTTNETIVQPGTNVVGRIVPEGEQETVLDIDTFVPSNLIPGHEYSYLRAPLSGNSQRLDMRFRVFTNAECIERASGQ